MPEPTEPITDEMISAYLDGELTAEQRHVIEQAMARDSRYGQQLRQLQSLREALQELPTHHLNEGFAERVLQRIGAASNGAASQPADRRPNQSAAESSPVQAAQRSVDPVVKPPRGWRRGLVWSALVVAAAVALMLFDPKIGREDNKIASGPGQGETQRLDHDVLSRKDAPPSVVDGEKLAEQIGAADDLMLKAPQRAAAANDVEQLQERGAAGALAADQTFSLSAQAPLQVILQVNVTTEQLTDVLTQLRESQLAIVAEPPASALARVVVAGPAGARETTVDDDDADARMDSANVRAFVVQATLAEMQAALARANVRGQQLDASRLAAGLDAFYSPLDKSAEMESLQPRQEEAPRDTAMRFGFRRPLQAIQPRQEEAPRDTAAPPPDAPPGLARDESGTTPRRVLLLLKVVEPSAR